MEMNLDEVTGDEFREAISKTPVNETNLHGFIAYNGSMMRMVDKKDLLRAVSKATNYYHDQNIIKDGGSGKIYKGKLSGNGHLMYIAVWRFNRQYRENYIDDFKRELEFLSALKHDNISSIFAYFDEDEDDEKTIIYKHAFHGNLQGHLTARNPALTWSRRLQICLGVARALNYIHNEGLIHCDINSSKILLDVDWKPMIFGFELCTEFFQSWTHRLRLSRYLDATNVMTPTHDVYLFGVLLFEVLCGKKPMFDEDGFSGKLDEIIDPSLRKQIESQSMKLFQKIAHSCLYKKLVERPSMKQIVKELKEALELQLGEENIERSTNRDEGALWNRKRMVQVFSLSKLNNRGYTSLRALFPSHNSNHSFATTNYISRYCVNATIADDTTTAKVVFFDEAMAEMLDITCKDMVLTHRYIDPKTIPDAILKTTGITWLLQLTLRKDGTIAAKSAQTHT